MLVLQPCAHGYVPCVKVPLFDNEGAVARRIHRGDKRFRAQSGKLPVADLESVGAIPGAPGRVHELQPAFPGIVLDARADLLAFQFRVLVVVHAEPQVDRLHGSFQADPAALQVDTGLLQIDPDRHFFLVSVLVSVLVLMLVLVFLVLVLLFLPRAARTCLKGYQKCERNPAEMFRPGNGNEFFTNEVCLRASSSARLVPITKTSNAVPPGVVIVQFTSALIIV